MSALADAVEALAAGPTVPGARAREEIATGLFSLHVGRRGHEGRNFVLFRIGRGAERPVIEVLRILHDAMDPARHAPSGGDPEEP